MNSLIKIAAIFAILAVSTGQLPKILYQVQFAQIHPIKASQASHWPKAMPPPVSEQYFSTFIANL